MSSYEDAVQRLILKYNIVVPSNTESLIREAVKAGIEIGLDAKGKLKELSKKPTL